MTREEFEKQVGEAIDELPQHIREKMNNVVVVVEALPTIEQLKKGGTSKGTILLGLYQGVPMTRRYSSYTLVLPDKITIFQESIQRIARSNEEIKEIIKSTVWHEVAHHFGIDESGVRKLEQKRAKR